MPVLTVVGIDVGFSFLVRSSGVCRTGAGGFALARAYADRRSRLDAMGGAARLDVVAIDGPLRPGLVLDVTPRLCEKLFVLGKFQKRCKPGESHIEGTGRALTRAAVDTALQLLDRVGGAQLARPFPRVVKGRNLIEAFPNAFLGVLVPEADYGSLHARRRDKTQALLDLCRRCRAFERLKDDLRWPDDAFWAQVDKNTQHDEVAALICALTAVCVVRGLYTAVGDEHGGFFFLPPLNRWQEWARDQLGRNLGRSGCPPGAPGRHVWVNGARA